MAVSMKGAQSDPFTVVLPVMGYRDDCVDVYPQ